jgi:hypothetical protein
MSVDFRTRTDAEVRELTPATFFAKTLPALLSRSVDLIAPWLSANNPKDATFDCEGDIWSLSSDHGSIRVRHSIAPSGFHVRLSNSDFSLLVNDLVTPMTFFTNGTLDILRGDLGDFLDWWLIIRAVLDQRPIHVNSTLEFNDLSGKPMNLARAFAPGDSPQEMRHFLETAGFIYIAGVFKQQEMDAISADMDRYQSQYSEGDKSSWWATTKSGERRLVRLQSFDEHSQATRRLLQDERFRRLGEITEDGHVHRGIEGNRIEALIKPLNVVKGISDLPWHKDCSLGRHSYECCSLTVGISVTGAGPESGQLRVIAGSHRVLMWPSMISDPYRYGMPVIDLPTQTGDVTIHLSCTHHMAQAPTHLERRVMYTSFWLPSVEIDLNNTARARIIQAREAAYKNVSQ